MEYKSENATLIAIEYDGQNASEFISQWPDDFDVRDAALYCVRYAQFVRLGETYGVDDKPLRLIDQAYIDNNYTQEN